MLFGVLLVFLGLVLFRPIRLNLGWSLDVKDWLHWVGISAASLLAITTVLALRLFRHRVTPMWLNIHCISSAVSAALALVHSRTKAAVILPVHYHSYLTLGLLLVLAVSGALIRLYPENVYVRRYWRLYHLPFSICFYVTLLYHVVLKLGVI
ncbi:hypothetical protein E2P71_03190 [Candidatus Bathyarchaeota archaeon]|nr:hypothetical protein E2P71_03190 [Candidatus Bathyarchaeota archaeon]